MSALHIPPETWRHLLRSLLRECSYLPDPVARLSMKADVLSRYQRYYQGPKSKSKNKPKAIPEEKTLKQIALHRTAHQRLSLLKRANEGYYKPLEEVLQMAYGRRGKRRIQLVNALIAPKDAPGEEVIGQVAEPPPDMFSDGWTPPKIMVDLLNSQRNSEIISTMNSSAGIKHTRPHIPKVNIWGKELSPSRQRNIKKKWYNTMVHTIFPPLPDTELRALEGLISGEIPWTAPKRRTPVGETSSAAVKSSLDVEFLTKGPQKQETFTHYTNGRPHKITHRLMRRLWKRISCLVPRQQWNDTYKKSYFTWDVLHSSPCVVVPLKESMSAELFQGIDAKGSVAKEPSKRHIIEEQSTESTVEEQPKESVVETETQPEQDEQAAEEQPPKYPSAPQVEPQR
ncbi:hypothetical protein BO70DRAFT_75508 [Aspergillus heteromorphus CBS 117.55]|uniref:LYR motif-containing protein Cup1-like N-terminal domain-containing protein n=1 Tax=Aspergillus heteromorphus CBS 117.55 TaxID=1448321 RepID=A0A317WXB9_9EURO|nr:uncharacterized protein BO70DRAFT_75508 [Aspergillus heteromorphus CBS 117.55]PWY90665.1 hypothetical protein BO70DRAFT_75508 [Aspergillus heteromorphus CBS 117.55]